jgi:HEAT repeat protein
MDDPVYTLIQQTYSPDSDVQLQSARSLGTCDLSEHRLQAIQALCGLLRHEHLPVREAAKDSLIQIGGTAVVDALILCLKGPSTTALNYALEILGEIGQDNIDRILKLLESKDHDIRKFGCDLLGNLRYSDSVYELIELLNDPHINVAIAAGEALGKIGSREAVSHLIRALQYPDSWMRCIAAEALGKIGNAHAVDAFLEISFDEEPIVLYTIVKAMGNLCDIRVLPYTLSLLKQDKKFASSVVQTMQQLIKQCGDEAVEAMKHADVAAALVPVLSGESQNGLLGTIRLVGTLRYQAAVPALQHLLHHADETIATEALTALTLIDTPEHVRSMFEQTVLEITDSQRKRVLQQALDEIEMRD